MSSLIQIKYGVDSVGNVLSLAVNTSSVGSYKSTLNSFFIYLKGVDPSGSIPIATSLNFQTKLQFSSPIGSPGATGAGNFMESLWNNALYSPETISTLDFQTPGFQFTQEIISS